MYPEENALPLTFIDTTKSAWLLLPHFINRIMLVTTYVSINMPALHAGLAWSFEPKELDEIRDVITEVFKL